MGVIESMRAAKNGEEIEAVINTAKSYRGISEKTFRKINRIGESLVSSWNKKDAANKQKKQKANAKDQM